MGSVIGSCVGSCAGAACCAGCDRCAPKGPESRAPYLGLLFFSILFAVALNFLGTQELDLFLGVSLRCPDVVCVGNQVMFRISLALTVFFALHCLVIYAGAGSFHTSAWLLRVILYIGLSIGVFFLPQETISSFADASRFFAGAFLIIEILLLIDFAYAWNEKWVEQSDDAPAYLKLVVAVSAVMYIASYTMLGFMYHWFASEGSCDLPKTLITITILVSIAVTFISISDWCQHGSLLTAAVVTVYAAYACFSALSSYPSVCNSLHKQTYEARSQSVQLWLGLVLAAASICRAAWSVGKHGHRLYSDGGADSSSPMIAERSQHSRGSIDAEEQLDDDKTDVAREPSDEEARSIRQNNAWFHLVCTLASMYFAMLLTNWGSGEGAAPSELGETSMWVKVASQWVALLMFTWTLVAPYLLPDRDFS